MFNYKKVFKTISGLVIAGSILAGCTAQQGDAKAKQVNGSNGEKVAQVVEIPSDKYPETAQHVKEAIKEGHTDICTIDRGGAADRRKQSLAGIKTVKGKDRDEFPMAMCKEGGKGAHVKLIDPSDNRGAGSYVGNKLDKLSDGTKVRITVK
ncbi:NucA/NucB deoxyribonuclease domain-containing protein [Bacillus cereus group sp. MYBK15-3]|uniref:NucA/NucB deoxyribonuclease domain-containing protein n=1 Tax=Bacillus cereus group TaxID=86661 RepID=UPI001C8C36AF|nr:NucA/NucB deoxyribonuclease domain-containing protein [Bacillus cereus]MBX9158701.1 sporulation protein [Bacillus cereus]